MEKEYLPTKIAIISLSNKKLQLTEETFCSTLSTCRREWDTDIDETGGTELHVQTALD